MRSRAPGPGLRGSPPACCPRWCAPAPRRRPRSLREAAPRQYGPEVAMQSVAVLRPHALLWRNPPVWPFLWRGLLPLAALALVAAFAVGPVAHDWIEDSVARETRSRLAAAGFSWVSLSASGQTVTLSGE